MKKVFCVVLIFLGFLFLCFCSKKQNDTRVVLKFSSWGSQSEIKFFVPLIDEFEKQNPDIKVEFLHIPQNYFQKLHLLFASNLSPDVIFINNYYLPKYVSANLLDDLTFIINKDDYFEKAVNALSINSKVYAVPRDVSNFVVYYNKNLFKKYNIPFPNKNWSLNDYLEIAKTFKDKDVWGTSLETDFLFLLPYLYSNGASLFDDVGQNLVIDSKDSIATLQFCSDLVNKHKVAPSKTDSASLTMAQLFLQEKVAMHVSGRWLVPKYRSEAKFDWDVVEFPRGKLGSIVNVDASGYALSSMSKHKNEAIRFIKYISSQKSLEILTKNGLIVPARKDVAYSRIFLDANQKPQNAKVFITAIETGKNTIVNKNYQKVVDVLNKVLEPVFLGKRNAEDVFTSDVLNNLVNP